MRRRTEKRGVRGLVADALRGSSWAILLALSVLAAGWLVSALAALTVAP